MNSPDGSAGTAGEDADEGCLLQTVLAEKRGLEPNRKLLSNALRQTGHEHLDAANWRASISRRLRSLDWKAVLADLRPFVERQSDLDALEPSLILRLLSGAIGRSK